MSLDPKIDELYRLPLGEFTGARNVLAKTLKGDEKARVQALAKPTVVPWAVNQLFWRARSVYDALMKSGVALRSAQVAALQGRAAGGRAPDVPRAAEAHRDALAKAVREATRLAEAEAVRPGADDLSRTLESLSLSATPPEQPGRLIGVVRPAGFEALAGLAVRPPSAAQTGPGSGSGGSTRAVTTAGTGSGKEGKEGKDAKDQRDRFNQARRRAEEAAERKREQELEARRQQAEAGVKAAERDLERARDAERKARESLDEAERVREAAQEKLTAARKLLASSF